MDPGSPSPGRRRRPDPDRVRRDAAKRVRLAYWRGQNGHANPPLTAAQQELVDDLTDIVLPKVLATMAVRRLLTRPDAEVEYRHWLTKQCRLTYWRSFTRHGRDHMTLPSGLTDDRLFPEPPR